ncbi:MAG TPA: hypothetical protein VHV83_21035 [Armatimonadota bacterium]|nr:hypothetical protein [Armatimonadota bacterium]
MFKKRMLCYSITACFAIALAIPASSQNPETSTPTHAQRPDVSEIFKGTGYPVQASLGELQGDWLQFTIDIPFESIALLGMFTQDDEPNPAKLFPVFYTQGKMVTAGDESYLVAYQQQVEARSVSSASNGPLQRKVERQLAGLMTEKSRFSLCLLNTNKIGSLLNIHPFQPQKTLTDSAAARTEILSNARKERLQLSVDYLQALGEGITNYSHEHGGVFPNMASFDALSYDVYVDEEDVDVSLTDFAWDTIGKPIVYHTNANLTEKKFAAMQHYPWLVLAYEAEAAEDGTRAVLFANGKAKRISDTEWTRAKTASKIR